MIIIDDIEQGSPEWDFLRIANLGASQAKSIITTKGEPSKSADALIEELANEAVRQRKTFKFSSNRMKEGLEDEILSFNYRNMILQATHGVQMRQVALCYKNEKRYYHVSPDGIQEEIEEGFETKDALAKIHYERIQNHKKNPNAFYVEHKQQVQMSLYVTGYKRWILQSYCRGMNPLTLKIYPDLEFHRALEKRLNWFVGELYKLIKSYREAA